jgi:hypothetical protein
VENFNLTEIGMKRIKIIKSIAIIIIYVSIFFGAISIQFLYLIYNNKDKLVEISFLPKETENIEFICNRIFLIVGVLIGVSIVECCILLLSVKEKKFIDIARNDNDYRNRIKAVEKINNKTILADIAQNDSNAEVRLIAYNNLKNKVEIK